MTKPCSIPRYRRVQVQEPDQLTREQREFDQLMRERPKPLPKGERP
jgi:hypothetical protein